MVRKETPNGTESEKDEPDSILNNITTLKAVVVVTDQRTLENWFVYIL